jgi:hypothetical protein
MPCAPGCFSALAFLLAWDRSAVRAGNLLDFVEKPDYRQLERSLRQYQRVWLVLSHAHTPSGLDSTASSLSHLLSLDYPNVEQHEFDGLEIVTYSKQNSAHEPPDLPKT